MVVVKVYFTHEVRVSSQAEATRSYNTPPAPLGVPAIDEVKRPFKHVSVKGKNDLTAICFLTFCYVATDGEITIVFGIDDVFAGGVFFSIFDALDTVRKVRIVILVLLDHAFYFAGNFGDSWTLETIRY